MKFFLPFVCLLCFSRDIFGKHFQESVIRPDDGVSYQDLIDIGASCYPKDSCKEYRNDDPPDIAYNYSCSCNEECWQFDTCCIDSPRRVNSPPNRECRSTGQNTFSSGYYMVNRCPDNSDDHSIWKHLCEKEWNEGDDILLLSPVTSLETSSTYKNYYCFKCYESSHKYISWNLFLQSDNKAPNDSPDKKDYDYTVTYSQEHKSWVATIAEIRFSIPVNISFLVPYALDIRVGSCNRFLISDCPATWRDNDVRYKCNAYTAIVYKGGSQYKNAHCALCNNISMNELTCEVTAFGGYGGMFSFQRLIDLNGSSRDKAGNEEKCEEDHVWDPYGERCSKISCAIPEYVVKNKSCVPPELNPEDNGKENMQPKSF